MSASIGVLVQLEYETHSLSRPFTYLHDKPLAPGLRVRVPFGRKVVVGLVVGTDDHLDFEHVQYREILEVLDEKPVLNPKQLALAQHLARETIASLMSVVRCMLPKSLAARSRQTKPATQLWVVPNAIDQAQYEALTSAQKAALEILSSPMPHSAAVEKTSAYRVGSLVKAGALRKEKRILETGLLPRLPQQPWPDLTPAQQRALDAIEHSRQQTTLLFGVTGSGKTELFYHLAQKALDQNKQVLILVPEIALTPMMEKRFASRLDADLYACHSRLNPTEMLSVWNGVAKGKPCVVIGTRKAVFLPFTDLGVIIMDEEHDSSYKQDSHPRYHAKDAAQKLAALHDCQLVLSSATPSLESYARALRKVYGLAALPERAVGKNAMISLIDLRSERIWNQFSSSLITALQNNLNAGHQSMLLLNRRGYLPTVHCQSCGEYLVCSDCGVPLSFHKEDNMLVCHVCGKQYTPIQSCPACGAKNLSTQGQGTERLEETVTSLFPSASIVRMDHDTTRKKGGHQKLLEQFEQTGDILLGTQMIAKGFDFHNVTLAGILSIDGILARPDYLASEKAYQLAEQAAGRAGRGDKPGRVLIQTFNPHHFVLRAIARHSYQDFFVQEMKARHAGMYPPYTYLASVVLKCPDRSKLASTAELVRAFLASDIDTVLGPAEISMRNGQPRLRLVLKDKDKDRLRDTLWKMTDWYEPHARAVKMEINVSPMSLEEL